MTKKKIVYISHPIYGKARGNILKILAICQHIHRGNVLPIAPYLTPLSYLDDNVDNEKTLSLKYNKEFFTRKIIDELWLYGDTVTENMNNEIKLAKQNDIPIKIKSAQIKQFIKSNKISI